jgi:hypothetical protein
MYGLVVMYHQPKDPKNMSFAEGKVTMVGFEVQNYELRTGKKK